eukprot:TRINITY_DN5874_c0_g1_i1.p1 TRINITY_DN5874_c0_g1~~TRINITY_DN5874_c0_g1_i1.p1  ORF type:complete len:368 (-),score=91.61 TRINITY_DN5874_c0_g1_i1:118-1221(-)
MSQQGNVSTPHKEKLVSLILKEIESGRITLSHVVKQGVLDVDSTEPSGGCAEAQVLTSTLSRTKSAEGMQSNPEIDQVIRKFFSRYDVDNDGVCDNHLLPLLLNDLGEDMSAEQHAELLQRMDLNKDGSVQFKEFKIQMLAFLKEKSEDCTFRQSLSTLSPAASSELLIEDPGGKDGYGAVSGDDDEPIEDEAEIPDEWRNLSCGEREKKIKHRAYVLMSVGLALIMVFSDPMVSCLDELGKRIHVGSFYVAFVLAPLASNSSEVLAAYVYGSKKTKSGTTTACETLVGAAIMNNTFVLAVFLIIVVAKDLKWEYTAETVSILAIQLVMFYYTQKKNQRLLDAFVILSLYPLSIGLVAFLENVANLN